MRRLAEADASAAGALLLSVGAPTTSKASLRSPKPRAAFARVLAALLPAAPASGIDSAAVVSLTPWWAPMPASVPASSSVGAEMEPDPASCRYRDEHGSSVGQDCLLYANVTVYPDVTLGDRVIVHSGVIIGADGFGFATDDGMHVKIRHTGRGRGRGRR